MWEYMLLAYNFWVPMQALILATYMSLPLPKILVLALDLAKPAECATPSLPEYT
jgi:hypothetical protein